MSPDPATGPGDPADPETGSAPNPGLVHWREPYLLLLSVGWPQFLGLVTSMYLLINLLFAALYRLDPAGIGGTAGVTSAWARGLFFSVQTLGSIGYGALYPASLLVNVLVTTEALVGLIFIALTTGLVFARFARPAHSIRFAAVAVVHPWNGGPVLELRLANARRTRILASSLQAFLASVAIGPEGLRHRCLEPLGLDLPAGTPLALGLAALHRIDAASPLQGLGPSELLARQAELLVTFSGIDETMERPIHALHRYGAEALLFNACFSAPEPGASADRDRLLADLSRTRPWPPGPTPTVSSPEGRHG